MLGAEHLEQLAATHFEPNGSQAKAQIEMSRMMRNKCLQILQKIDSGRNFAENRVTEIEVDKVIACIQREMEILKGEMEYSLTLFPENNDSEKIESLSDLLVELSEELRHAELAKFYLSGGLRKC